MLLLLCGNIDACSEGHSGLNHIQQTMPGTLASHWVSLTGAAVGARAASSAAELLITRKSLEGLPAASAAVGGLRRFFDIAVPRDIGADVNELEGEAHVYNVDDLKEVLLPLSPSLPHISLGIPSPTSDTFSTAYHLRLIFVAASLYSHYLSHATFVLHSYHSFQLSWPFLHSLECTCTGLAGRLGEVPGKGMALRPHPPCRPA